MSTRSGASTPSQALGSGAPKHPAVPGHRANRPRVRGCLRNQGRAQGRSRRGARRSLHPMSYRCPRMEVQAAFTHLRALDSDAPSKDSVQNTCPRVCTSGAVRPSLSTPRLTLPRRPLVSWSMSDLADGSTRCIFPSQLQRSEQADPAPPSGSTQYQ